MNEWWFGNGTVTAAEIRKITKGCYRTIVYTRDGCWRAHLTKLGVAKVAASLIIDNQIPRSN